MTYDEIINRLNFLYSSNDCVFYPTLYKFEIGANVAAILKAKCKYLSLDKDCKPSIFNIEVGLINYHDPECIRLWKECT